MRRESVPDIEDRLRRWLFDQLPQAPQPAATCLSTRPPPLSSAWKILRRCVTKRTSTCCLLSRLSLANIRKVPIDTLKVDRSLMRDIGSPETRALTDAIIAVAESLSLTVIAAGVETQLQADFAREHACDAMQGFYVSEPASAAGFAALLQQRVSPRPS